MNFYASVASDGVSSLLVRQKKNQVGLSMCGHISGHALNQPKWISAIL
jgi:hypothetical protein